MSRGWSILLKRVKMKTKPIHKECENCGKDLIGVYCAHCGQKDHDEEFKLTSTLKEWLVEHFDVDGTVFRSLKDLVFFPGKISRRYANGQRVGMVRPIRMLLSLTVLMVLFDQVFPISTNMVRDNIESYMIPQLDTQDKVTFFDIAKLIDKKSGVYLKKDCNAGLEKTVSSIDSVLAPKLTGEYLRAGKIKSLEKAEEILKSGKAILSNSCNMQGFIDDYSIYIYWFNIPFGALIILMFFKNFEPRYVMHLVFLLHVSAFGVVFTLFTNMFGLLLFRIIELPPFTWMAFCTLTSFLYMVMAIKGFVNKPWKDIWGRALLSTLVVFIIGSGVSAIFIVLLTKFSLI